jgi:hypothetical protein
MNDKNILAQKYFALSDVNKYLKSKIFWFEIYVKLRKRHNHMQLGYRVINIFVLLEVENELLL